jgi:hypothetical protein
LCTLEHAAFFTHTVYAVLFVAVLHSEERYYNSMTRTALVLMSSSYSQKQHGWCIHSTHSTITQDTSSVLHLKDGVVRAVYYYPQLPTSNPNQHTCVTLYTKSSEEHGLRLVPCLHNEHVPRHYYQYMYETVQHKVRPMFDALLTLPMFYVVSAVAASVQEHSSILPELKVV